MAWIGRPKTRVVGYVAAGQYTCRMTTFNREINKDVVCGEEVPEGELTNIAVNNRVGRTYILCTKHRQALAEAIADFAPAILGEEMITAARVELANGSLVSHSRLREALLEQHGANGKGPRKGPLTPQQIEEGVRLLYGDEAEVAESSF